MKITYILFLVIMLYACTRENAVPSQVSTTTTTTTTTTNPAFDITKAQLVKSGTFVNVQETASGTASVYSFNGKYYVVLDPFATNSGPDVHIYFSKDSKATDYINLGKLLAFTGKQMYTVQGNPTIADYNYIHVWCQQYSINFGQAALK